VVSNLRFIDLCNRGALRPVRLCLTTPSRRVFQQNRLKTAVRGAVYEGPVWAAHVG
jgi:hypothetical protein